MWTAIFSLLYILGWSVIPVFDKKALKDVEQHALTWCVFLLCMVFLGLMIVLFTEDYAKHIGIGLSNGFVYASAVGTSAVYYLYFHLLNDKGMIYIVILQPVLLITQTILAVVVLKEKMDWWNVGGMAVIVGGMVLFNKNALWPSAS